MAKTHLKKREKSAAEVGVILAQTDVKDAYENILKRVVENAEVSGFRKGKAPRHLVEPKIDKRKLYQEVLELLLPQAFSQAVSEHKLFPIVEPKIEVVSMPEEGDWEFLIHIAEKPEVALKNFQSAIKSEFAASSIVIPGKEEKEVDNNQKLDKIFDLLLNNAEVTIPELLIESEVQRMLTKLVDQTNKLGLTIEQYLNSSGKNIDQLKADYRIEAEKTLKLEFIMDAIATAQQIQATEAELSQIMATVTDQATKATLDQPEQQRYLSGLIRKRKVVDFLLGL